MFPYRPFLLLPTMQIQNTLIGFYRGIKGDLIFCVAYSLLAIMADSGDQQRRHVNILRVPPYPLRSDLYIRSNKFRDIFTAVERVAD